MAFYFDHDNGLKKMKILCEVTVFFYKNVYFGAKAECSFKNILRISRSDVLKTFLNIIVVTGCAV